MKIPWILILFQLLAAAWSTAAEPFEVRTFGAKGDGTTLDTQAIQAAIDAASAAGGGVVHLSPGTYLSGSVMLRSRVVLDLDQGATLLGTTDLSQYQRLNFLALVGADRQEDIGITGKGTIDGQGKIIAGHLTGAVTGGNKPDARESERPVLINFRGCRGVTVRGVTLRESACWVQLYRDCQQVLIEGITVRTMATITNDGLDLDGCSRVIVRDCDIDSEDDGICLKSSRKPCQDILVERCRIRSSCNALKFGTASAGGFIDITCRDLDIHDTYLSAIALELVDGGTMRNVTIANVRITTTNNPLFIRLGKRNTEGPPGTIDGVTIRDVTAVIPNRRREEMNKFPPAWRHRCRTLVTGSITGIPGHPVKGVTLRNIDITYGGIGPEPRPDHHAVEALDKIPACIENYPESTMFGILPAWGLFLRHAEGITLERVTLRTSGQDYRPAVVGDDVRNLVLDGLVVPTPAQGPAIVLRNAPGLVTKEVSVDAAAIQVRTSEAVNAKP